MKKYILIIALVLVSTLVLSGCENSISNLSIESNSNTMTSNTDHYDISTTNSIIQNDNTTETTTSIESNMSIDEVYKIVFDNYFNSFNELDVDSFLSACLPCDFVDMIEASKNESSEEELYGDCVDYLIEANEYMRNTHDEWREKYGGFVTVNVTEFTKCTPLNDKQLSKAQDYIYDIADELGIENFLTWISDGYMVEYKYELNGESQLETGEAVCYIVNLKNDGWKFISYNYGIFSYDFTANKPMRYDPKTGESFEVDIPLVVE